MVVDQDYKNAGGGARGAPGGEYVQNRRTLNEDDEINIKHTHTHIYNNEQRVQQDSTQHELGSSRQQLAAAGSAAMEGAKGAPSSSLAPYLPCWKMVAPAGSRWHPLAPTGTHWNPLQPSS